MGRKDPFFDPALPPELVRELKALRERLGPERFHTLAAARLGAMHRRLVDAYGDSVLKTPKRPHERFIIPIVNGRTEEFKETEDRFEGLYAKRYREMLTVHELKEMVERVTE